MGILRPYRVMMLGAALSLALQVPAQRGAEAHVRAGDKWYKQMAYAMAIPEYKAAAEMGAVNEHVSKRLADSYRRTGDTENAELWYSQVVKFLNRQPADLFFYAQALKGNGKYDAAEEWMDKYLQLTLPEGEPRRSNISDYARKFAFGAERFSVHPVGVNTPDIEMAPAWLGSTQVIFASSRERTTGVQRVAAWDGQPFLDLYVADRGPNGDLSAPRKLAGDVNSRLHEGPCTVSHDERDMWFTRNNRQRSGNGVNKLGIMHARYADGTWSTTEPFTFNNTEISVAHPSLSADGQWIVFASDMPGGMGGMDLYRCRWQGGQWSEPENLGPLMNTPRNEVFPFVAKDGTLWFSSDGHPGLGGYDVFAAQRDANGHYGMVINAETPVNSPADDTGFIIDTDALTGYFSSDRHGGSGADDIYAFTMNQLLEQRYLCTGFVIDDENDSPLIDVEVRLLDAAGQLVSSTATDAKGTYTFAVEKGREYRVAASMTGRFEGRQFLSTMDPLQEQIIVRDIHLLPDAGVYLRGVSRPKDAPGFLSGMSVSVVNLASFFTENKVTGDGGDFNFRLQPNEEYEVLFEMNGYFRFSVPVSTAGMRQGVIDLNTANELRFEPMFVEHAIKLKHMRWSGERGTTLDPVSRTELDGISEMMLLNGNVDFDIAVHSDARGDEELQPEMTQRRADAIRNYLKGRGIPETRMKAKGYGSSRPLNHCVPGVQCTEAEHAVNRRYEIVITSIHE